jgi:hypothetical protein
MTETEFDKLHHRRIWAPGHPYCYSDGTVLEYRLEVEKAIGRYLKPEEVVHHHYNADGSATLVLCPDRFYHQLLHIREKALRMCGNASYRRCMFCMQYDNPENMSNNSKGIYHKSCCAAHQRERRNRLAK